MKKLIVFTFLIWIFGTGFIGADIYSIQLKDVTGKFHSLTEYKGEEGTAFIFLLADCPASQYYSLTLNQLSKKYESKKIRMIGVFAGKYLKPEEVARFVKEYKIAFPILTDKEMQLAGKLNAHTAPEAFLLDKIGNITYMGRIDDTYYAPGRKKNSVSIHDLENAIIAQIQHKKPATSKTKAIGCILEY